MKRRRCCSHRATKLCRLRLRAPERTDLSPSFVMTWF